MITAEEIKKIIGCISPEAEAENPTTVKVICTLATDLLEARQRIAELEQRWIPVSERLPENETNVLCMLWYGTIIECRRIKNSWYLMYNFPTPILADITHWMPLPEPPKEQE